MWAAVPLMAESRCVGVLGAGFSDSTELDAALLLRLGEVVGTAVDTANNFDRIAKEAADAARGRMRQDVHDGLSQQLFSLNLQVEAALAAHDDVESLRQRLADVQRMAARSVAALREATYLDQPEALDRHDLRGALEVHANELSRQSGLEIAVHAESDLTRLPTEVAADAYRLVQEAMNNVVKHARARCIAVELTIEHNRRALVVTVVDDGVGFMPSVADNSRSGLRGMHSRAARHGGQLQVRARTETSGTEVRAHFALDERVAARSA